MPGSVVKGLECSTLLLVLLFALFSCYSALFLLVFSLQVIYAGDFIALSHVMFNVFGRLE